LAVQLGAGSSKGWRIQRAYRPTRGCEQNGGSCESRDWFEAASDRAFRNRKAAQAEWAAHGEALAEGGLGESEFLMMSAMRRRQASVFATLEPGLSALGVDWSTWASLDEEGREEVAQGAVTLAQYAVLSALAEGYAAPSWLGRSPGAGAGDLRDRPEPDRLFAGLSFLVDETGSAGEVATDAVIDWGVEDAEALGELRGWDGEGTQPREGGGPAMTPGTSPRLGFNTAGAQGVLDNLGDLVSLLVTDNEGTLLSNLGGYDPDDATWGERIAAEIRGAGEEAAQRIESIPASDAGMAFLISAQAKGSRFISEVVASPFGVGGRTSLALYALSGQAPPLSWREKVRLALGVATDAADIVIVGGVVRGVRNAVGSGGTGGAGRGAGDGAAQGGQQGGLNLFKWGDETSTTAQGWREGDRFLHLPNKGSPKANWKQNAGRLREEMRRGEPIYDSYRNPGTGAQTPTGGFLNAERKLLESRGWRYNPSTGTYHPPSP